MVTTYLSDEINPCSIQQPIKIRVTNVLRELQNGGYWWDTIIIQERKFNISENTYLLGGISLGSKNDIVAFCCPSPAWVGWAAERQVSAVCTTFYLELSTTSCPSSWPLCPKIYEIICFHNILMSHTLFWFIFNGIEVWKINVGPTLLLGIRPT